MKDCQRTGCVTYSEVKARSRSAAEIADRPPATLSTCSRVAGRISFLRSFTVRRSGMAKRLFCVADESTRRAARASLRQHADLLDRRFPAAALGLQERADLLGAHAAIGHGPDHGDSLGEFALVQERIDVVVGALDRRRRRSGGATTANQ